MPINKSKAELMSEQTPTILQVPQQFNNLQEVLRRYPKQVAVCVAARLSENLTYYVVVTFVLTYVTTGVFNFAYGAIAYAVAYVYYQLHTGLKWSTPVAALVALLIFAPLLGLLLDRAIFQNLSRAPGVSRVRRSATE